MYGNNCIDEDFKDPTRIAVLRKTVNEKCGFEFGFKVLEDSFDQSNVEIVNLKEQLKAAKENIEAMEKKIEILLGMQSDSSNL